MDEPLQLNAGFEHTNGVAARLAACVAGARSTNGKITLDIEEIMVAHGFNTKGKRGKSMLLFHFKGDSILTSGMAVDITLSTHLP